MASNKGVAGVIKKGQMSGHLFSSFVLLLTESSGRVSSQMIMLQSSSQMISTIPLIFVLVCCGELRSLQGSSGEYKLKKKHPQRKG